MVNHGEVPFTPGGSPEIGDVWVKRGWRCVGEKRITGSCNPRNSSKKTLTNENDNDNDT